MYNGECFRDFVQQTIGQTIKNCPACGETIKITDKCRYCNYEIDRYVKQCPGCKRSLEINYSCKCGSKVFKDFLPGTGTENTGKLLDLCRSLHAEENAILNLAKYGARLPSIDIPEEKNEDGEKDDIKGCVLYSTTFPCNLCANKIVTMGIRKVVYAEPYDMKEAKEIFSKNGVKLERFQGVKSRAFSRFYA